MHLLCGPTAEEKLSAAGRAGRDAEFSIDVEVAPGETAQTELPAAVLVGC